MQQKVLFSFSHILTEIAEIDVKEKGSRNILSQIRLIVQVFILLLALLGGYTAYSLGTGSMYFNGTIKSTGVVQIEDITSILIKGNRYEVDPAFSSAYTDIDGGKVILSVEGSLLSP